MRTWCFPSVAIDSYRFEAEGAIGRWIINGERCPSIYGERDGESFAANRVCQELLPRELEISKGAKLRECK